jgi:hypothetical protein
MRPADDLLRDASTELRRLSVAKTPAAAEGARARMEHYLLPEIAEADCPCVAFALHRALRELLEKRRARGWVPSI